MATVLLSAAYFLSGLCALIYETVWIYRFSRIFGSTAFAMSFVVAVFFAGLAAGSHILGKKVSRSPNPLRLYAFLELAIGGYALVLPLLILAAERIYAGSYASIAGSFAGLTAARAVLAFAVLFPPTLLMGGTLPVLVTCFVDRMPKLGSRAGLVYGMNALGAALGSFLSGYALLELLGVAWTNAAAATLNLAIGCLAWALSRRIVPQAAPPPNPLPQRGGGRGRAEPTTGGPSPEPPPAVGRGQGEGHGTDSATVPLVLACFAVSGFVSMSYEVFWLRYLTLYLHETIYLYTGIIAVFVLGIGLGSLIGGYLVAWVRRQIALLGLLQALIGLLSILAVYLPLHYFQPIYNAGLESAGKVLLILLALLTLPAALMGATFPVVTKIIVANLGEVGSQVGRAYALNTLGGILGLLCSGFVLHHYFGLQVSLYILFGLDLLLAAALLTAEAALSTRYSVLGALRYIGALPLVAGLAALVLIVQYNNLRLPQAVIRKPLKPYEKVLEVREGVVGITWATTGKDPQEVHLWENGCRIGRGGRSTFLAEGYIPMLLAPRIPRDVLGLAFGAGLSYRGARLFPEVRRLDFVDISLENIAVALRHFPENAGLSEDPRARFIVDDAYSFVKYNPGAYDLILMEPTPPRFSYQTASLYTREFYEFARQRLANGGCFCQVLPLKDLSAEETACVMHTFSAVFEHCLLWRNGWDCLMLGQVQAFHLDVQVIAERLNRPVIQESLRECAPTIDKFYLLDNFLSGLLLADEDFRQAASGGTTYTDDRPGLRFATGRNVTTGNIRAIHAHLSPWPQLRQLFGEDPGFKEKEPLLTMKREYFMALLYKHKPREFYDVFLRYVKQYSQNKDFDLNVLRIYLLTRDMNNEAGELDKALEDMESAR